jgi:hypothetical protein
MAQFYARYVPPTAQPSTKHEPESPPKPEKRKRKAEQEPKTSKPKRQKVSTAGGAQQNIDRERVLSEIEDSLIMR